MAMELTEEIRNDFYREKLPGVLQKLYLQDLTGDNEIDATIKISDGSEVRMWNITSFKDGWLTGYIHGKDQGSYEVDIRISSIIQVKEGPSRDE